MSLTSWSGWAPASTSACSRSRSKRRRFAATVNGSKMPSCSYTLDRYEGHVRHGRHLLVEERDQPAGRSLAAVDGDREGADEAATIQDLLHLTPQVLHVGDPMPEGNSMHHEQILFRPGLGDLDPHPLLVLARRVRPLVPDRGVHGMVAGRAVHASPGESHLHDPLRELSVATGMPEKVPLLVLLSAPVVIAVVARVIQEDVSPA